MMSILVSNLLLCILLLFTSGGLLTLTLSLEVEDANMISFCSETERQALLDVKASLDVYGDLYNWVSEGETTDCCKWVGVRCSNHTGHVIELDLGFNPRSNFKGKISPSLQVLNQLQYLNLRGSIPYHIDFQSNPLPKFLGSMSNLRRLDISCANLSGPIPHQLSNLSNLLHLDLSRNSLEGSIPFSFGDMTSLTYLDLSQNKLGGVIPKSFGNISSLAHVDLSQNLLNGSLPIFVGCSSLITLSLADNSFNGSMFDFTRCTSLKKLDLSRNFLSENMSNSTLGQLSNLEYLDVGHNSLNGNMPDFTGCTFLQHLDLSSNFFSGSILDGISKLSNLEYLNVSHNFLNGSIPDLKGLPSLSFLDLSSNQLSGNVPNSLGSVSNLGYLDFSSNSLEGVISKVHFLNLNKLFYLDLSLNSLELDLNFSGRIPFNLISIKLQSCQLGPRFPMWIETQDKITHLDISNAGISDDVPSWFWDLISELSFLNISSNEIKGMLPDMTSFFVVDNYPGLDLSNNHFEGRIPSMPSELAALNLSGNRFSGTLSFLCGIEPGITFLDLSNNSLSGSLPDCWLRFQTSLVVLNLSNNSLSGKIPSSLGFLSKLQALYLRSNSFEGEMPMSLSNCRRLRFVDLGENELSGAIPEWIGEELSELYVLVLGSNRFYGRLPAKVCRLYNLQVLDLSNNALSGSIPRCFGNFTAMAGSSFGNDMITIHSYSIYLPLCKVPQQDACNSYLSQQEAQFLDNAWVTWKGAERSFGRSGLQLMKTIDLSRNNFSGKLPHEITSLYELLSLNLSNNQLYGEVPKNIGRMTSLESLDLSRNEFSGHIPWTLANLTFLGYLNLSSNNLSGRIPTGPQLQLFDYTSYSGNPQLCGPPLTIRCGLPPVVEKTDVEEDEEDFWKSYYTGMGAGFAVGFLGICGALILNRHCRYFFFASREGLDVCNSGRLYQQT